MASMWKGSIGQLKKLQLAGILREIFIQQFEKLYGSISPTEVDSWLFTVKVLVEILGEAHFDTIQVIFELQMPVSGERADVILLGGKKSAIIIELKQWSTLFFAYQASNTSEFDAFQHPSLQVLNYYGKLKMFNPVATDYTLRPLVFLPNFSAAQRNEIAGNQFHQALIKKAPIVYAEHRQKLADFVRQHLLPNEMNEADVEQFENAPPNQTIHMTEIVTRHALDIARRAEITLAEKGVGLTTAQRNIVKMILDALSNKEEKVFCITGKPGSGKTLVAIALLLNALQKHPFAERFTARLAMRNSRLLTILRNCFKSQKTIEYLGADGVLSFFSDRFNRGVGDENGDKYNMIICDEAQRMTSTNIARTLRKASICVFFLDENQRLNPKEQGTIESFRKLSKIRGKEFVYDELPSALRCTGGNAYHNWVENLLRIPHEKKELQLKKHLWRDVYRLEVADSAQIMIETLQAIHTNESTQVALVASFTESPGHKEDIKNSQNVRVGPDLTSGWDFYKDTELDIRWVMKDSDYAKFWMDRGTHPEMGSNLLNFVASVYGAQGLESDYIGLFWGRDLLFRNGRWQLGPVSICYDDIDGLVKPPKADPEAKEWGTSEELTLALIFNRYRIFLSRGIKGTIIFCEDAETRNYLKSLTI